MPDASSRLLRIERHGIAQIACAVRYASAIEANIPRLVRHLFNGLELLCADQYAQMTGMIPFANVIAHISFSRLFPLTDALATGAPHP
jgi:hypothetical protein